MNTWADVNVGDVIQSPRDHQAYEVTGKTGDGTIIVTRDGKDWPLRRPSGSVVILLSMKAAMAQAVALTQVHLGGRVHAVTEDSGQSYRVPVDFVHAGELHSHIYVMHGITSVCEGLPDLVKQHVELHRPEIKATGWVEHVHDPRFAEFLRRQSAGD